MTEQGKTVKIIDQDFGFIKGTDRVLILGASGAGKSVTMHYIAEGLHAQGVGINMLAPSKVVKLQKEGKLPSWIKLINYKYPYLEPEKMTLFDDAQLKTHARESMQQKHIELIKVLSVARHKHAGIIFNTQQGAQIDRGTIGYAHYVIFKQPGLFMSQLERPEFRKLSIHINTMFNEQITAKGLDPRQYSYVVSDMREGFVGPTGLPTYWSKELGDW